MITAFNGFASPPSVQHRRQAQQSTSVSSTDIRFSGHLNAAMPSSPQRLQVTFGQEQSPEPPPRIRILRMIGVSAAGLAAVASCMAGAATGLGNLIEVGNAAILEENVAYRFHSQSMFKGSGVMSAEEARRALSPEDKQIEGTMRDAHQLDRTITDYVAWEASGDAADIKEGTRELKTDFLKQHVEMLWDSVLDENLRQKYTADVDQWIEQNPDKFAEFEEQATKINTGHDVKKFYDNVLMDVLGSDKTQAEREELQAVMDNFYENAKYEDNRLSPRTEDGLASLLMLGAGIGVLWRLGRTQKPENR